MQGWASLYLQLSTRWRKYFSVYVNLLKSGQITPSDRQEGSVNVRTGHGGVSAQATCMFQRDPDISPELTPDMRRRTEREREGVKGWRGGGHNYLRCPTDWARSSACRFQNWRCSFQTRWGRSSAGEHVQGTLIWEMRRLYTLRLDENKASEKLILAAAQIVVVSVSYILYENWPHKQRNITTTIPATANIMFYIFIYKWSS